MSFTTEYELCQQGPEHGRQTASNPIDAEMGGNIYN